jgi:uncharacterized tellurite resistance protein B-like protein
MRFLQEWFGLTPEREASGGDTIRRIADELDRLEPAHARYLASFAFILARVAHADSEVSDHEVDRMEGLVAVKGGVTGDQASLVVQMARTQQKLFGGTDDFLVTRELEKSASYEQKLALIDCLYAVAAADDRILTVEGNEIARIGRELKVDQADLSRLRAQYRRFLEASKGLGET